MLALPAVPAALEADAVVTSVALKHADPLYTPAAEVAIVELKPALHELFFAGEYRIALLDKLVALRDGAN